MTSLIRNAGAALTPKQHREREQQQSQHHHPLAVSLLDFMNTDFAWKVCIIKLCKRKGRFVSLIIKCTMRIYAER
jgi:hypothetical protein